MKRESIGSLDLETQPYGNTQRLVAIMRCAEKDCGNTFVYLPGNGKPITPAIVVKKAAVARWEADTDRRARCRCPAHAKRAHAKETDVKPAPMNPPVPKEAASNVMTLKPPPVASAVAVPTPSKDHRISIRLLLDTHFDDSTGMYLDGMTDEKVALQVGVAPAVVERIREAAYGPIRVDTELVELREQQKVLNGRVAALLADGRKLVDSIVSMEAECAALTVKINLKIAGKV